MARHARLIAALALAVLLAHSLALEWLAAHWQAPSVLQAMAPPMLTRQIVAQQPPASVVSKPNPPKVRTPRPSHAPNSIANSLPASATPTAPEPAPEPEPAASAPAATATAAAPANSPMPTASVTASASSTASPTASELDGWPSDTRLSYRLSGNYRGELHGSAQVQWQREADRYQVRVAIDIGWLASLVMTSQGRVTPQGLRPSAYEEDSRGRRRSARLTDDAVLLDGGERVPRPEGVQDTASQFVELAHQFASGRAALEVGKTVGFWMARPGGVDQWTYDIDLQETLQTPALGAVQALHLKPRPLANPRGNITAEMWFAPSLQYLPVRIRIKLGDDANVDLLVEKIEQK